MTNTLKPFEVVRTPKMRDSRGEYVKRGEIAHLDKALAKEYQARGFIKVSMEDMFDADDSKQPDAEPTGPDGSADQPTPETEPGGPQPDPSSGNDDEEETGEDAAADAGTGSEEAGEKPTTNRRRKRASS